MPRESWIALVLLPNGSHRVLYVDGDTRLDAEVEAGRYLQPGERIQNLSTSSTPAAGERPPA